MECFCRSHSAPHKQRAKKAALLPKAGARFFLAVFAVLNFKRDVVITPCFIFVNAQGQFSTRWTICEDLILCKRNICDYLVIFIITNKSEY